MVVKNEIIKKQGYSSKDVACFTWAIVSVSITDEIEKSVESENQNSNFPIKIKKIHPVQDLWSVLVSGLKAFEGDRNCSKYRL